MNNIIETINLTHRYGDFTAVKDVNLTIYEGEIFGFLGPNGAGKTTTIRMLLDFIRPDEGSAKLFGMDSVEQSVEIRKRVGFLPAELALWENQTGKQYIKWLSSIHNKDLMPEAKRLAERLQFDLNRKLSGMSTGMKRKIGIIAAMAHKPPLLILDEPTNGLDPLMQAEFHRLMREVRQEGRTVFLSSHMLTEVEEICDRVAIIRDGEIQAVETIEKLTRVSFRWLTLTFANAIEPNGFREVDGVTNFDVDGRSIRMKVAGDANIDQLVKLAAQHTVEDLTFEQPTLEEIFLAFYGERSE
jgi:ABC-2 type transport system ATP-binding protein